MGSRFGLTSVALIGAVTALTLGAAVPAASAAWTLERQWPVIGALDADVTTDGGWWC